MELSLVYFAFIFLILLSTADPTEFDNQCPTSRRLLLFGGSDLSKGEKKSPRISSSSKPSIPSSPPKYARSSESNDLMVYIRPETSSTARAHKGRSYTHLLKAKPHADKEKKKVKRSTIEQKKSIRKKNSTQHKSSPTTKSQELVAIDDQELNRCRALLHLDIPDNIEEKIEKKEKKPKTIKPSKIENDIEEETKNIKKKVVLEETSSPVIDKKTKITKVIKETNSDEKKPVKVSTTKTNDNRPVTSSIVDIPMKISSSQSTTNTKSKRDHKSQSSRVVEQVVNSFDTNDDQTENSTDSVVNRAFHFVKNMFQLSDDSLNGDPKDDNHLIDIANEQQQQQQHHHHHSRKLLTIDEHDTEGSIIIFNQTNEYDINLKFNNKPSIETTDDADDLTYVTTSISKRQLLSVKTNKQASPSKSSNTKEKKAKSKPVTNAAKPKVGWAYRYRISRYLNAQKMKRTGNKNKGSGKGEEKSQHSKSKQKSKKTNSKNDTKVSKRKLLGYCATDDSSECNDKISNPDIVNSVLISETFIPKRQLLASKSKNKDAKIEKHDDNHHQQQQQTNTRRQMKSFEESTDPIAIVNSYDRGLFKPRVGWQFRYRVSRYIDSLRENIREDQERLKLGLQAIKRKTPQELSGRRKRVLDKPFAPDVDELKKQQEVANAAQENKPHAGWRYRYRISKMNEAKKRGDFIDDEEEKRKAFREQKQKQNKSRDDNRKPIEGEEELDSELRQISDEGRRVGWAYRYRIRRKLDDLKHQQAITGKPFDITTLGGKREKKIVVSKGKSIEKKKTESVEQKPIENKKSVGWEYRYRISKMKQAQKGDKSKVSKGKQLDRIPVREQMDPELTRLTPEQRAVGWKYRYRIRRKLDATKDTPSVDGQREKRMKKTSSKGKKKEKIIKKVEESIEKILNIDDIDETPFMEYFRRGSSYILFGLIPPAKKSICLLPLPVTFSFCNEDGNEQIVSTTTTSKKLKKATKKKLKTKKEQRAKQFIHARVTKLGADDKATERRVDETMKKLYKKPSLPPLQVPPTPATATNEVEETSRKQPSSLPKRSTDNENLANTKIGVDSKKNKNKKQFQIIGKEVKTKRKHASSLPSPSEPVITTDTPLVVEPTTTTTTTTTTTASPTPRLRSISEVIQEDAANILGTNRKGSRTPEEVQAEVEEANEIVRERTKHEETIAQPTPIDIKTSSAVDNDETLTNNERKTTGENVQQSVHRILNLDENKDS